MQGVVAAELIGEPALEALVADGEVELIEPALAHVLEQPLDQHFAGSVVPQIDVEGRLVPDERPIGLEPEMIGDGLPVEFDLIGVAERP